MKKLILLIAFFLSISTAFSQSWQYYDSIRNNHIENNSFDSAIHYTNLIIKALEESDSYADSTYFINLNNMIELKYITEDYQSAINYSQKYKDLTAKVFGEESNEYAAICNVLAVLYRLTGDYEKAEPYYKKAMTGIAATAGKESEEYAVAVSNYGMFNYSLGKLKDAEKYLLESKNIIAETTGTESESYATTCNNLGNLYIETGEFHLAEAYLTETRKIQERLLGIQNLDYGWTINNLAVLYKYMGKLSESEKLFTEVLQIEENILGNTHPNYALNANNLGSLYEETGNYQKAEEMYLKASEIFLDSYGSEHPHYAISCSNLAGLYEITGRLEEAESLHLKTLDIRKQNIGENHYEYAVSLNNLGKLYLEKKDYEKAESSLEKALEIFAEELGIDNRYYIITSFNHADLKAKTGDYSKAVDMLNETKDIIEQTYGKLNPNYLLVVNKLAENYYMLGDYSNTDKYIKESLETSLNKQNDIFSFLSEHGKEHFIKSTEDQYHFYQSFYSRPETIERLPSSSKTAYEIAISLNGVILNSGINMRQSIIQSESPEALYKFDQWTAIKTSIANQYTRPHTDRQANLNEMILEAEKLESELTRLSYSFANLGLNNKISYEEVKNSLNENEIAIEFASFRYFNTNRPTDSILYKAIIIRKEDESPLIVNLFEQDELGSLMGGTSNEMLANTLYRGVALFSEHGTMPDYGGKLYNLVWKKIDEHLKEGETIYFSPAGSLHQIAFAAIIDSDGKSLSDKYNLIQLSSTAQLVEENFFDKHIFSEIILFGGIDYTSCNQSEDIEKSGWDYLPGTLAEIQAIEKIAKKYNIKNTVFTGQNAGEEIFKDLSGNQSLEIIHIASHGFFFPKYEYDEHYEEEVISGEKLLRMADNPLSRAGILFAGANLYWTKGKICQANQDGILTALEAGNLNLSNTNLVVLSACETGLGDIKGSEGVYGLQRAFKTAGAKYLLMSLWKVPDAETALFMKQFYENLFTENDISKAFRKTQDYMKEKFPKDPYSWAAFVLVR